MRVLELLEEIEEIVDTAAGFPLTGKIMVDSQELLEIVREIRAELPDEIQQAQWIKNERERIMDEAKKQYEMIINDAQKQAEALVENNDITTKSKMRAEELMKVTENTARQLKIGTYDYLDGILYSFQGKMSQLSDLYFGDMFSNLEKAFKDNVFGNIRDKVKIVLSTIDDHERNVLGASALAWKVKEYSLFK